MMVIHIRDALRNELSHASWMSKQTQAAALKKLNHMKFNIGYLEKGPDLDYAGLIIDQGVYAKNLLRVNKFLISKNLNTIGKPNDHSEWVLSPQKANSEYSNQLNALYIPAGVLQPPFYDVHGLRAVNYGALGASIGHEMTHAFDDVGAQYDSEGILNNWWNPQDLKKFRAKMQCLSHQYSQYKVDGNLPIQGDKVTGEAAADLGGIILAFQAFHDLPEYKNAPVIAGFSPMQQFFIAFAHKYAANRTPEMARQERNFDAHPPWQYRVNGTLANLPQFQQIFSIPPNSPMVNPKRCVIW